ncbi:hypothetical protein GGI17_000411 [Coemansia sp. S146]|nr:hypothetical protein GGI17_000411 [Coemansia sp. S146]
MATVSNGTLVYWYTLDNQYPPPMIEYDPVRWVAFLVSALFLLLSGRALMASRAAKAMWLNAVGVAAILAFISLILRGAMDSTDADTFRMYEAQTVLHLCAAYILVGVLLVFSSKWIEEASGGMVGIFLTHMGIGYSIAVVICTCTGFPLAFDAAEERRISGYRLVSVSLIVSIGVTLLAGMLVFYHASDRTGRGEHPRSAQRVSMITIPTVLLVLMLSFVLARVSLPTKNAANTSDALFYCLSVIPLAGVIAVWAAGAEEFLSEGGEQQQQSVAACYTVESGDSETEYSMQELRRAAVPCLDKRVAVTDNPACVMVCCCKGGLCARCKYEAMLQQAMQRYC